MSRFTWLACCIAAVGCVSVSKSVLTDRYASRPVPRDDVYVFLASAGDTVPEACQRVAILHASGAEMATEGKMYDKLREEAGKLGANAVFVQNMEDPGTGERVVGALFGTGTDKDSDAVALYCPPQALPGGRASTGR